MAVHSQTKCFSRWPMGFRFHPKEMEVMKYLLGFVTNNPLPLQNELMHFADLYAEKEPWQIFEACKSHECINKNVRYIITQLKKVKADKKNVSRSVGSGTWKPQDSGKEVRDTDGRLVGFVKSLKYIPSKKSSPTNNNKYGDWLMREYSLADKFLDAYQVKNKGFVICRIKKKEKKGDNIQEVNNDGDVEDDVQEYINSVLQGDHVQEDVNGQSNDTVFLADQTEENNNNNNEYYMIDGEDIGVSALLGSADQVQDQNQNHQFPLLWRSPDDVDLDTISYCF